jgi:anti-sigma regulatory factor (Ser/Thr protein kinase)
VKLHPDGRNVSITADKFPPAEADIDARNLESAIYNLLLNACQAATRSTHVPEVKVRLMEVDERIYVTILDNGPGIPASVQRTLFDPFATAGKPNGTGLGLTLARRIAEEHGGSVGLEESNSEGAVFTLSLKKNRSLLLEDLKSGGAGFEACSNGSKPGERSRIYGLATRPEYSTWKSRKKVHGTQTVERTESFVVKRADESLGRLAADAQSRV